MNLDPKMLIRRAEAIDDRDPETAARLYENALQQEENHPHAWANLGSCYYRLKDREQAEFCWAKSIELDALMPEPYYNMGCLFLFLEQYEAAARFLRHSIELDSDNSDAYYNLGIAAEKLGNINESLAAHRIFLTRTWSNGDQDLYKSTLKTVHRLEHLVLQQMHPYRA
jgi:tetratricopeptide (TPR) repeat protein